MLMNNLFCVLCGLSETPVERKGQPPLMDHLSEPRRGRRLQEPCLTLARSPSTSTSTRCGERVTLASRGWPRTGRLGTPTRLPRWGPRPAGRGGVSRDKRFSPSTPGSPARIVRGGVARTGLFAVRQAHGDPELCRRVADRPATANAESPTEVARA